MCLAACSRRYLLNAACLIRLCSLKQAKQTTSVTTKQQAFPQCHPLDASSKKRDDNLLILGHITWTCLHSVSHIILFVVDCIYILLRLRQNGSRLISTQSRLAVMLPPPLQMTLTRALQRNQFLL